MMIIGEIMAKVKNPFVDALKNIAERQDIQSFKKIFDYFGPRLKSFLMKSGADEASSAPDLSLIHI